MNANTATHETETASAGTARNPGLAPYDISGYRGLRDRNFFELNPLLRRILKRLIPAEDQAAVFDHLQRAGEVLGGRVNDLLFEAYRDEKLGRVERFDSTGNRVERVVYSQEMEEAKRLVYQTGITNRDFDPAWQRPFHLHHRYAGLFMSSMNGEAGLNCGLGMTEGLVRLLEKVGSEEQKTKWLPRLTAPDSDWHFTVGQFMSERVGGSNIGANRTTAYPQANGKWKLVGEKWFCSNPGELWVTTARVDGTKDIGVFLVSRIKEDGQVNGHHILRKKDKSGARANLTLEMEYRDVEAEAIGNPRRGLANLMKHMVNSTRVGVAMLSTGTARRAFLEAREYANIREAYGQKILEYDSVRRTLASLQVMTSALELANYRNLELFEQGGPLTRFLTQWLKARCSSLSHTIVHEALLLHGANGTFRDFSVMPRLFADGLMMEFWEGTHNIIAGHSMKAFSSPKARNAFLSEVDANIAMAGGRLSAKSLEFIREQRATIAGNTGPVSEYNRLPFLNKAYDLFVLSLFARESAHEPDGELFDWFLEAYVDLCKYGFQGYLPEDSVFNDREKSLAIIDY